MQIDIHLRNLRTGFTLQSLRPITILQPDTTARQRRYLPVFFFALLDLAFFVVAFDVAFLAAFFLVLVLSAALFFVGAIFLAADFLLLAAFFFEVAVFFFFTLDAVLLAEDLRDPFAVPNALDQLSE